MKASRRSPLFSRWPGPHSRPSLRRARISILADGRVAYLLRKPRRNISEGEVVVAILAHLGLPTEEPPIARARSPGFDFT